MDIQRLKKSAGAAFVMFGSLAVLFAAVLSSLNNSFSSVYISKTGYVAELVRTGAVSSAVTFEELEEIKAENKNKRITGYSEIATVVSNKYGLTETGIKAVLTDIDYSFFYQKEMINGIFPDVQAFEKAEAYAVISDRLAFRLFKTTDVVENEINLLGRRFKIISVYRSNSSVVWDLCGDGFDRIYIPYNSIDNGPETAVNVLAVLKSESQSSFGTPVKTGTKLDSRLGTYRVVDHSELNHLVQQYNNLMAFILGAVAIILTLKFIYGYSKNAIKHLKMKADSYYIPEMLKAEWKRVVLNITVLVFCCFGMYAIISLTRFKLYVPDRFIPEDNLFDLSFYFQRLLKDIQTASSYRSSPYSLLELVFNNILQTGIICIIAILFSFISAMLFYKLLLLTDIKARDIAAAPLFIVVTGGIAGFVMSALLGLQVSVPAKIWAVMAYCFIIRGMLFFISRNTHGSFSISY